LGFTLGHILRSPSTAGTKIIVTRDTQKDLVPCLADEGNAEALWIA